MISHYLSNSENLSIFPVVGLLLFLAFFISLIIYLFFLDKGYVREMSEMPLGNDNTNNDEFDNLNDTQHGNRQ